jgi:hypothetical protein
MDNVQFFRDPTVFALFIFLGIMNQMHHSMFF